jgi:hypothetical protein
MEEEKSNTDPKPVEEDDGSLLKPKQKRTYTPEQKEAMAERMRKVNAERIANAKHSRQTEKEIKKMNMIQRHKDLEEKLKKMKEEEVKTKPLDEPKSEKKPKEEKIEKKKDIKKKKPSIKIINVQNSDSDDSDDHSDSDDSSSDSDISIPQAKIVVINKKPKSKGLTKDKVEKKVEPVVVPEIKRPICKFL